MIFPTRTVGNSAMASDDSELSDPLVVLRAQFDQVRMLAPDGALLARAWFDAFRERGFTEAQACYLAASQLLQSPGVAPG